MNIYESLNQVINYIELNLDKEISLDYISKVLGTNKDTAKRLFSLLTNNSLNEYIKKRRLSKAAFDIENSNEKIIDIALKYGYENPTSFSKAFKKFHGILPSQIKSNNNFKNFPPFSFQNFNINNSYDYKIKNLDTLTLYGISLEVDTNNVPKSVKGIWKEFNKTNTEYPRYGILVYNQSDLNQGTYWICLNKKFKGAKKLIVPQSKYMSIKSSSFKAEDISALANETYMRNVCASDYQLTYKPDIEIYTNDDVEILLPIK